MLRARGSRGRRERVRSIRRWRLIAGLFLMVFLATHLANHALGLAGREALAEGRTLFLWLWRNPVAETLLALALVVHLALSLYAVYMRRRLEALGPWDVAQLLLGLSIVPLLAIHIVGTVGVHYERGIEDNYDYLYAIFVQVPYYAVEQIATLLVTWGHGAIGLWFWLRLKPGAQPWRPWIVGALVLLPVLALTGMAAGMSQVAILLEDPAWQHPRVTQEGLAWVLSVQRHAVNVFLALLALTLVLRWFRLWRERRMGVVRIGYPDRRSVRVTKGTTILEASQQHRIPHASVCGGRGRCSTCRVRVLQGGDELPPPSEAESAVLMRVRAAPGVRLACQTRPSRDVDVVPLLPPTATPREAQPRPGATQGEERELAVLFADLRSFTTLSEKKLPYDVVFVLNRYFRGMAAAIEGAGGYVDKFIGDGVMALFGLKAGRAEACRQAIRAAEAMTAELVEINRSLRHELPQPLRIGIGIHVGHAIVGEMGAGSAITITAVGDTVNAASRIESLTKDFDAELVISAEVAEAAGYTPPGARAESTVLRGRTEPLALLVVGKVGALSPP